MHQCTIPSKPDKILHYVVSSHEDLGVFQIALFKGLSKYTPGRSVGTNKATLSATRKKMLRVGTIAGTPRYMGCP